VFVFVATVNFMQKHCRGLQDVDFPNITALFCTSYMTVFSFTIYCKVTVHIIIHYLQAYVTLTSSLCIQFKNSVTAK
jgi:hypothetical protein